MKDIQRVHEAIRKTGFKCTGIVAAPRSNVKDAINFRNVCKTNKCGNYDKSWTCPPAVGKVEDCLDRMHSFDDCIIVTKRFDNVNVKNPEELERIAGEHQSGCRSIKHAFMDEGFDILALTDGACNYCESCTYPNEPCRAPDERVPSVSGYGIDMGKFIPDSGLEFSFSDDHVTFYGLMLFR